MIFEHIISAIAPFPCLGCQREGSILCTACQAKLPPSTFVSNDTDVSDYAAATLYKDVAKDVVHALKFGRAQSAAECIAHVMADRIAVPSGMWVVTHVPTANNRVRLRGYDQAQLIAKHFARLKNVPYAPLLARTGSTRQVGANRDERLAQAHTFFRAKQIPLIQNAQIIIIDDVITTGASMHAASQVLMKAGAQAVWPVAFAHAE